MPLHLSQHKSYHPYNQANKERVRRDQALEAHQEQNQRERAFSHRDQARLEALRSRRNSSQIGPAPAPAAEPSATPTSTQTSHSRPHPRAREGHSLLRPQDELKPWYTDPHLRNGAQNRKTDDQLLEDAYKDSTLKSSNDPLKAMQTFLAQRKAAKHLSRPEFSSSTGRNLEHQSDLYEPDAVRAAKALRSGSSHRRHSATHPHADSHERRRHSSGRAPFKDEDRTKRHRSHQRRSR